MKFHLTLLSFLLTLSCGSKAQEYPKPSEPYRLVNDLAGLMDTLQRDKLEVLLNNMNDSTDSQVMFVSVPELNGISPVLYCRELFKRWDIGNGNDNNGVLILFAAKENKAAICVGEVLLEYLPDDFCNKVCLKDLDPLLVKKEYYKAAEFGVKKVFDQILMKDRPKAGQRLKPSLKKGYYFFVAMLGLVFAGFMFYYSARGVVKEFNWNKDKNEKEKK